MHPSSPRDNFSLRAIIRTALTKVGAVFSFLLFTIRDGYDIIDLVYSLIL